MTDPLRGLFSPHAGTMMKRTKFSLTAEEYDSEEDSVPVAHQDKRIASSQGSQGVSSSQESSGPKSPVWNNDEGDSDPVYIRARAIPDLATIVPLRPTLSTRPPSFRLSQTSEMAPPTRLHSIRLSQTSDIAPPTRLPSASALSRPPSVRLPSPLRPPSSRLPSPAPYSLREPSPSRSLSNLPVEQAAALEFATAQLHAADGDDVNIGAFLGPRPGSMRLGTPSRTPTPLRWGSSTPLLFGNDPDQLSQSSDSSGPAHYHISASLRMGTPHINDRPPTPNINSQLFAASMGTPRLSSPALADLNRTPRYDDPSMTPSGLPHFDSLGQAAAPLTLDIGGPRWAPDVAAGSSLDDLANPIDTAAALVDLSVGPARSLSALQHTIHRSPPRATHTPVRRRREEHKRTDAASAAAAEDARLMPPPSIFTFTTPALTGQAAQLAGTPLECMLDPLGFADRIHTVNYAKADKLYHKKLRKLVIDTVFEHVLNTTDANRAHDEICGLMAAECPSLALLGSEPPEPLSKSFRKDNECVHNGARHMPIAEHPYYRREFTRRGFDQVSTCR